MLDCQMLIIFFSLITLVASSDNTIVWNCKESQVQNFTIVYVFTVFQISNSTMCLALANSIANSDPKVLVSPQAIIAIEQNFDCSKTITQQQESFAVGTGYIIQLANPLNSTDVSPHLILSQEPTSYSPFKLPAAVGLRSIRSV